MIITRRLPPKVVLLIGLRLGGMAAAWATSVYLLYAVGRLEFLRIPFLPISTIGTAVAFYVGFKNNASYDRFWEGRKIWGGIVNDSRSWATAVMSYVDVGDDSEEAHKTRRALIYRQLAWINALRLQLRKTSRFFHKAARATKKRLALHAVHMRNDWDTELRPFVDPDELTATSAHANPAAQLLLRQGTELAALVRQQRLDIFHQIAMMGLVQQLYTLQGKCERIKNTPFPRQYAEFSRVFTKLFVFLAPFGLLDVFADHLHSSSGTWQLITPAIPMVISAALIAWVFGTMEAIGDASEDPFERSLNDVPLNALCRTIEIDLRQMLGETDVPEKEAPIDDLLY